MHKKFTLMYCIALLSSFYIAKATEKVLIVTHVHNRPDFIEMHARTFKAFLKEDYEYIVFNDAPNEDMKSSIEQTCSSLGITCIRIPQELHNQRADPGARHIHSIQYSLEKVAFDHDGIVFIIDSDMFLVRPFSILEYLENYNFIGQKQERPCDGIPEVTYVAPLLVFMNMQTLPNKRTINFDGGYINGHACDVGGHIYYYFKDNPSVKIKFSSAACIAAMSHDSQQVSTLDPLTQNFLNILKESFDENDPHRMQFHGDNNFIHYVAGSNWNNRSQDYHDKKTRLLNNYINEMTIQQCFFR